MMYGFACYPLPATVETKSVSLGVDTEAASHPAITIALHCMGYSVWIPHLANNNDNAMTMTLVNNK